MNAFILCLCVLVVMSAATDGQQTAGPKQTTPNGRTTTAIKADEIVIQELLGKIVVEAHNLVTAIFDGEGEIVEDIIKNEDIIKDIESINPNIIAKLNLKTEIEEAFNKIKEASIHIGNTPVDIQNKITAGFDYLKKQFDKAIACSACLSSTSLAIKTIAPASKCLLQKTTSCKQLACQKKECLAAQGLLGGLLGVPSATECKLVSECNLVCGCGASGGIVGEAEANK